MRFAFWRNVAVDPDEAFDGIELAELKAIALELYRFSQAAVSTHKGLILTPSSRKAKEFSGQLGNLSSELREKAVSYRAVSPLASKLSETVGQYASWQNSEYDRLVSDFTGSLEKVVQGLKSSVDENAQIGGEVTKVEANLRRAAACGTIEEIRSALTEQVDALHEVVKRQSAIQATMKRDYEMSIKVLSEQLELAESRGRTDSLTKLPNRSVFDLELQIALDRFNSVPGDGPKRRASDATCFSLAVTDLNMFKWINDTLGHPAGDACLRSFASSLKDAFSTGGFCARLGGDEFVILYPGPGCDLTNRLKGLRGDLMKKPVCYDPVDPTKSIHLAFSYGVADVEPGDTPDSLYRHADAAMYEMKRAFPSAPAA